MNIELEKYKLVEWIIGQKNEDVISKLRLFRNKISQDSDWELNTEAIEKMLIEAGLKDIEEGKVFNNDEVFLQISKRYVLK